MKFALSLAVIALLLIGSRGSLLGGETEVKDSVLSELANNFALTPSLRVSYSVIELEDGSEKNKTNYIFLKDGRRWRIAGKDASNEEVRDVLCFDGNKYNFYFRGTKNIYVSKSPRRLPGGVADLFLTNPLFCAAHYFFQPARERFMPDDLFLLPLWTKEIAGCQWIDQGNGASLLVPCSEGDARLEMDLSAGYILKGVVTRAKTSWEWQFHDLKTMGAKPHAFIYPSLVTTSRTVGNRVFPGDTTIIVNEPCRPLKAEEHDDSFFSIPFSVGQEVWDCDNHMPLK